MAKISKNLIAERKKAGLTAEELAAYAGIPQAEYDAYESGAKSITLEAIRSISFALNIPIDNIMGIGEPPKPTCPHPEAYILMREQGRRVAKARENAGISQSEAAEALGIALEKYEILEDNGELLYERWDIIPQLASLLSVTELFLIMGADQPWQQGEKR